MCGPQAQNSRGVTIAAIGAAQSPLVKRGRTTDAPCIRLASGNPPEGRLPLWPSPRRSGAAPGTPTATQHRTNTFMRA